MEAWEIVCFKLYESQLSVVEKVLIDRERSTAREPIATSQPRMEPERRPPRLIRHNRSS